MGQRLAAAAASGTGSEVAAQGMDIGLAGRDPLVVDGLAGGALFEPAAEPAEVAEVAFPDAVRIDQHAA